MKNYSIIRTGNEYIVQADEKSILKIASRRRAARLVTDAAELLEHPAAPPLALDAGGGSSVTPAAPVVVDRDVTSNPRKRA